jgi:hypothetical protein
MLCWGGSSGGRSQRARDAEKAGAPIRRIGPLSRRLQAERLELLGPVAWQVNKTREADAAGHAIVGDGLDQARSEKGQRRQHCARLDGAPPVVQDRRCRGSALRQARRASLGPWRRRQAAWPWRPTGSLARRDEPPNWGDEFAADTRGRFPPGDDHGRRLRSPGAADLLCPKPALLLTSISGILASLTCLMPGMIPWPDGVSRMRAFFCAIKFWRLASSVAMSPLSPSRRS